ncbi:MAG: hypothetical protein H7146_06055 [Burkholderiaceae bacterium]|nr:hypothetical protein [Microbacteriaceae bacterium]
METAVSLVQVNDTLWRVTRREGDVLGYIDLFHADAGSRFRARRLLSTRRTFVNDGEFWAMSDAIDCFRGR